MELDKTKYKDFRYELPTESGKRIELIRFENTLNPVTYFHEYTGVLEDNASKSRVTFVEGTPQHPTIFHRVVRLNGVSSPSKSLPELTIVFSPLLYTYMWRYIDGDNPKTALDISSPSKGGKTKRKRKKRKSKLNTKRS